MAASAAWSRNCPARADRHALEKAPATGLFFIFEQWGGYARPDRHPQRRAAVGKIEHRSRHSGKLRWRMDESGCRQLCPDHTAATSPGNRVATWRRTSRPRSLRAAPLCRPLRIGRGAQPAGAERRDGRRPSRCLFEAARLPGRLRAPSRRPAGAVRRPIEIIMERRAASEAGRGYVTGSSDDPTPLPVRMWQEAVHRPGIYDLEVDTSVLSPEQCAQAIRQRLRDGAQPGAIERLAQAAS